MELTERQKQLVIYVDSWAVKIISEGGSNEELLLSLYDVFKDIRQIQYSCTAQEIDLLCIEYPGFSRFITLLDKSGLETLPEKVLTLY